MEPVKEDQLKDTVIVSGHPRTGTSTMMRMMVLGGLEPIASDVTMESGKYKFNPHGIYELSGILEELPKMTPEQTAGKVIKLVAPYLHICPLDRPVKIIFMTRDMQEIVSSLMAQHTVWKDPPWDTIKYARYHMEANGLDHIFVDYRDMVEWPRTTAVMVEDFLGLDLDVDGMVQAVDRKVREKSKHIGPKAEGLITIDRMVKMAGIERKEEEHG